MLSAAVVLAPVDVPSSTSVVPPELLVPVIPSPLLLDDAPVVLLEEDSLADVLGPPPEPWP